jgi:hypothetical protein
VFDFIFGGWGAKLAKPFFGSLFAPPPFIFGGFLLTACRSSAVPASASIVLINSSNLSFVLTMKMLEFS